MLASKNLDDVLPASPAAFENGARRQKTSSSSTMAFDVGFVVDGSNIVEEQGSGNFRKLLEFVKEVQRALPISVNGIHLGVATYGEDAEVNMDFNINFNQANFESAIDGINYPGGVTKTGNALGTVMKELLPSSKRVDVQHIIVLMTAGKSEDDPVSIAEEIRASGAVMFCIGVGIMFDRAQLDAMASSPSSTHVMTVGFNELSSLVKTLAAAIVKDVQQGPAQNKAGSDRPKTVQDEGGLVEAKIDLGFLIDGSSTVGEDNFRLALEFANSIFQSFWTPFGSVKVGVVVFGKESKLVFDFENSYSEKLAIREAIDSISYPSGDSYLGSALQDTKAYLYGSQQADGRRRILVVLSGSTSEDDVFLGAGELTADSVTVFCVGAGAFYDMDQLTGIATKPAKRHILTVSEYTKLDSIKETLINKIEEARTAFLSPKPTPLPDETKKTTESPFEVTSRPKNQPGGSTPGSQPGGGSPGSQPGGSTPGSQPGGSTPGSQPGGSTPGSQPGGSTPGSQPGGGTPGSQPGGGSPGSQPGGGSPDSQPGGGSPGSQPGGSTPGSQPGGSTPGSQPGGGAPGSQPGGGTPGSQPGGSTEGSQPGGNNVQGGNLPGNQPVSSSSENQPGTTGSNGQENPSPNSSSLPPPTRVERNISTPGQSPGTDTGSNKPDKEESGIKPVTNQEHVLDLVFLIDGSNAMNTQTFTKAKDFMKRVYGNFPISQDATHVGFAVYGCTPKAVFTLTEHTSRQSLNKAVDEYQYNECEKKLLGEGLSFVRKVIFQESARPGAQKVLVLIIAGTSEDDVRAPSRDLRDHGVIIFAVVIGNSVDKKQLNEIVSAPVEDRLLFADPQKMVQQLLPVVQNIRQALSKGAPPGPIEVIMDLGFLVDVTSDSFTPDFFPKVLRSIKMMYSAFIVNQDKTRVGVVTYNGSPSTAIALNQYNTIDDINTAIDGVKQSSLKGPGSLGQGITYTTNSFFKGNTRIQTPKILVIITSSKSRDDVVAPATEAKNFNITLFVIGVGSSVDKAELNSIASPVAVDHVILADYSSKDTAAENGAYRIKKAVQVNLGFLVDGSQSVPKANFVYLLDLVKYICSAYPLSRDDVNVGLGIIETDPSVIFDFDKYFTKPSLDSAIDSTEHPGRGKLLNLGKALTLVKTEMFDKSSRPLVRRVLIVILAGNPSDQYTDAVRLLRDDKIEMFVFSVGSETGSRVTEEVASMPHERRIIHSSSIDTVNTQALELIENLQIAKVGTDVLPPRVLPPSPQSNNGVIDLVILIEGGDNTKPQDFEQIKEIVKAIYRFFPVAKSGTHVAVAIFSGTTKIIFNLFTYFTVDEMDDAVDSAPYPGGESKTGSSLVEVKTKIFGPYGRKDIPHVLVTVMTGASIDNVEAPANALKSACVLMFAMGIRKTFRPTDIEKVVSSPRSSYTMISETFSYDVPLGQLMAAKMLKVLSVVQGWNKQCVPRGETKLDLVFLLDACRNIPSPSFNKETNIVQSIATSLPSSESGTHLAILAFSGGVTVARDLQNQNADISSSLSKLQATDNGCPVGDGLTKANEIFQTQGRNGVLKILVVITGGKSDDNVTKPAKDLQKTGVIVYSVGLGKAADLTTLGSISSSPASEFVIEEPDFPFSTNAQSVLLTDLKGIFDIGNDLMCSPKECNQPTATTTLPTTRPTRPAPPLLPPTLPYKVDCHLDAKDRLPIDIVFLIDGSEAISEMDFRSLMEITKITIDQFPISEEGVHVALVIYGSITKIIFNLDQLYDFKSIEAAVRDLKPIGGAPAVGRALQTVKDSVFTSKSRVDVSKRLVHMMCGKTIDDVVSPSRQLHAMGVLVITAGTCVLVSKPELCVIGSPPTCENAVLMKSMNPVMAPACEFAEKILRGVPPKLISTTPTTGTPTTPTEPQTLPPSTAETPTSPTSPPSQPNALIGVHVPVPVPVPVPVAVPVDPISHQPLDGPGGYPFHGLPNRLGNHIKYPLDLTTNDRFDDLLKSTYKSPLIQQDESEDFSNQPPLIDPLHPDPNYVHPVSHHIYHNGRILPHPGYPRHGQGRMTGFGTPDLGQMTRLENPELIPGFDGNPFQRHVTKYGIHGQKVMTGYENRDQDHVTGYESHYQGHVTGYRNHGQDHMTGYKSHDQGHVMGYGNHLQGHVTEYGSRHQGYVTGYGAHGQMTKPMYPHYTYNEVADGPIGKEEPTNRVSKYKHPIVECADTDPECSLYVQSGYCEGSVVGYSQSYLEENCKKTCGICHDGDTVDFSNRGIWLKRDKIPSKSRKNGS